MDANHSLACLTHPQVAITREPRFSFGLGPQPETIIGEAADHGGPLDPLRITSTVPERRLLSRCGMPHRAFAPSRFHRGLNTHPPAPYGAHAVSIPNWIAIIGFMRVLLPKERFLSGIHRFCKTLNEAFHWQTSACGFTCRVIQTPIDKR